MSILSYVNTDVVNTNFNDLLKKYDTDQNGFTQKEFKDAVRGITGKFTRSIIKITGYDNKIFRELNTNKDEVVSYDEFAAYIRDKYNLDFYAFKNMTLKEVCIEMDKASKSKKHLDTEA